MCMVDTSTRYCLSIDFDVRVPLPGGTGVGSRSHIHRGTLAPRLKSPAYTTLMCEVVEVNTASSTAAAPVADAQPSVHWPRTATHELEWTVRRGSGLARAPWASSRMNASIPEWVIDICARVTLRKGAGANLLCRSLILVSWPCRPVVGGDPVVETRSS
jgi:hypothetical protein